MKIKCPNCGSTAQPKPLIGTAYLCGCGQLFYVNNGKVETSKEICEKYEKANKKA